MRRVAPLRYGVIFKKAFSNVDVFKGFVRDILGIELEISHVETEKEFKPTIGHVNIKFDLYAEDTKNHIVVEIQHDRNDDHYDRFLHYHCVAMLDQVKGAEEYRPLTTVYTIVILTSSDKHKCDVSVIDFDPKRLDNGLALKQIKHKVIYICPKYLNEKTPALYQEWLKVIEDSLDNQVEESDYQLSEIQTVLNCIEEDDITPEERERMIEESYMQKAEQRGLEEGFKLGVEQGRKEERLQTKREMAEQLLKLGIEKNAIAQATGFSLLEIESLNVDK
jgi:predicted transposase/invertase (TIGR01784 family)